MAIECRYENWDLLPAETARAGRERRTDAMIALKSTTHALQKAREELKEKKAKEKALTKKDAVKGPTPRDRFLSAFKTPEVQRQQCRASKMYIRPGLFFNPVGEKLEFLDAKEVEFYNKAPEWVEVRLADLDPDVRAILDPEGKHEWLTTHGRSSVAYMYQHIVRFKRTGSWD